ncbi:MAG TPA: PEGA domain-containing protein [Polyangiales bacterium]
MHKLSALAVLAIVVWLGVPRAHAQQPPAGYAEAVTQALTELEANNYPEAREEFRRAHAIFPNARTLRGLGMVEFELRNYVQSVQLLEEALASPVKPLDGSLRTDTQALLARAQRYVGELRIEIDPEEATVSIDGEPAGLNADGVVRLEVGEHTLSAQAAGRATEKQTIEVVGGERAELRIRLSHIGVAAGASGTHEQERPPERRPVYKRWWLWTTIAVVVAGGAATAAVLLTRKDDEKSVAVDGTNTVGASLHTLRF